MPALMTPQALDSDASARLGELADSGPLPPSVVVNRHTGERIEFLRTGADTDGRELAFRFTASPGGGVPFFHMHRDQEEWFKCLQGELVVMLDDGEHVLRPGDELTVPRGTMHALVNRSDEDAVLETAYRPAGRNEEWMRMVHTWHDRTGNEPGLLDLAPFIGDVGIQVASPPAWVQRITFALLKPIAILLGRKRRMLDHVSKVYGQRYEW